MREGKNVWFMAVLAMMAVISWSASADPVLVAGDVINVDFGSNQTSGAGWNTFNFTDGSIANAVMANGDSTGVSVLMTDQFYGQGGNGIASTDPALGFPSQATSDYFYGDNGNPTAQIVFSNLDPSLIYQLTFFAARAGVGDNRETQYAISGAGGLTETLYLDAASNTDTAVTSQLVAPTASGDLTVDVRKGPNNNNSSGYYYLNVISLRAGDSYSAFSPVPAVGEKVVLTQTLSWAQASSASEQGVFYDVYLGTDPNGLLVKTTTTDPADFFYAPSPGLDPNTTYYWHVDAYEPNTLNPGSYILHEGPQWWFTTYSMALRLEASPVSQTVAAGSDVQLAVDAINATEYQWYHSGVPLANDPTNMLYSGEESATLTVYDVQIEDEGSYYCVIDNDVSDPITSETAQLLTRRQISWWKFENDLTDSINDLYPGAPAFDGTCVDPNFTDAGIDGSALEIAALDDFVTIPDSADYFNFYARGFTVSAWGKRPWKSDNSWEAYVSKQTTYTGTGGVDPALYESGWCLYNRHDGSPIFSLRDSFDDLYSYKDVDDNQWHLVTATYDAATGEGKVYIDGVLISSVTEEYLFPTGSPVNVIIGIEAPDTTRNLYRGSLDDVRIFSYPIDAYQVASLYSSYTGEAVCVANPMYDIAGPDGIGEEFRDCKVDLNDLKAFALAWLDCNAVPTCK